MTRDRQGYFLTLEGIEGAGKSSQVEAILEYLENAGIPAIATREPGGSELAEAVRQILLNPQLDVGREEELLLMFAARASHIRQTILPALATGKWVVCDRFTDASYAYQGGGRGISVNIIEQLEDFVQKALRPDHCLLFDLPVATGLERARGRGVQDRFEREDAAFFERIRNVYLQRARQYPQRYSLIDAGRQMADVRAQVETVLDRLLAGF